MTKVWRIKAQVGQSPTGEPCYDTYIFIDKVGENKRRIELIWRHLHEKTMFDGTPLEITYIHADSTIELTAKQIAMMAGHIKTAAYCFKLNVAPTLEAPSISETCDLCGSEIDDRGEFCLNTKCPNNPLGPPA